MINESIEFRKYHSFAVSCTKMILKIKKLPNENIKSLKSQLM